MPLNANAAQRRRICRPTGTFRAAKHLPLNRGGRCVHLEITSQMTKNMETGEKTQNTKARRNVRAWFTYYIAHWRKRINLAILTVS